MKDLATVHSSNYLSDLISLPFFSLSFFFSFFFLSITQFDPDLLELLRRNPAEFLPVFETAAKEVVQVSLLPTPKLQDIPEIQVCVYSPRALLAHACSFPAGLDDRHVVCFTFGIHPCLHNHYVGLPSNSRSQLLVYISLFCSFFLRAFFFLIGMRVKGATSKLSSRGVSSSAGGQERVPVSVCARHCGDCR